MAVEVREAVGGDARRIRDVHLAAITELGPQAYTDEQVAAWGHDRDPADYPIDARDTYVVVAEDGTAVVGFGWVTPAAGDYFQRDVDGKVTATYVHPSVSRRGVGSRIYAALEAEAIRRGCDSLGLWASRNAVPFYESQGYERVTEHAHEYREGVELTVVEMVKRPLE